MLLTTTKTHVKAEESLQEPEIATPKAVVETDPNIQELANTCQAVVASFIAPYAGVRTSPSREIYASISLVEEFAVESLIEQVEILSPRPETLLLLINTPGGGLSSSYKVARALRTSFKHIRVFVPHIAASGGTLVALTGNEIVMGLMSNLGPLDPQILYNGERISANRAGEAFERYSRVFEKQKPEDSPYPLKAMVDKIDPFLLEEFAGAQAETLTYVAEILRLAGHPRERVFQIGRNLIFEYPSHGYVLDRDTLRRIGLPIKSQEDYPNEWRMMRYWLGEYLTKGASSHHIRYAVPQPSLGSPGALTEVAVTAEETREKHDNDAT